MTVGEDFLLRALYKLTSHDTRILSVSLGLGNMACSVSVKHALIARDAPSFTTLCAAVKWTNNLVLRAKGDKCKPAQ